MQRPGRECVWEGGRGEEWRLPHGDLGEDWTEELSEVAVGERK
jgi:hypothetical protein